MPRSADYAKRAREHWRGITLLTALTALILIQLRADARVFGRWQGWLDQNYYLQSARAWAALNLDPSQHHYPGGYSLLAAPFTFITPAQPFIIPDMVCLAACLLLFVRICEHLSPAKIATLPIAVVSFLVATVLDRRILALWAVPWTTTAEAPCLLACLLVALRFGEAANWRNAASLGLAASVGAAFRPSDAAIMLLSCALYCTARLYSARVTARHYVQLAIAGICGLVAGLLPALLIHIAVHGVSAGEYAAKAAGIGFEWQLIVLRWVTLVIAPQPLFPHGTGIATAFPWFAAGCAGMLLAITRRDGYRHAVVAGAICLYWAIYFAFRDLHATGLWTYSNLHYFKWSFPFLVYWAIGFAEALCRQRAMAPGVGCRGGNRAVIRVATGIPRPGQRHRSNAGANRPAARRSIADPPCRHHWRNRQCGHLSQPCAPSNRPSDFLQHVRF